MFGFILGCSITALIAWVLAGRSEQSHRNAIIGIYYGFGAPDENGNIGWYRDNRNGSPFTDPNSKWGEAGLRQAIQPVASAPMSPPPSKLTR